MFAQKTVLILGAGASIDYGFPSGSELVKELVTGIRAGDRLFGCAHHKGLPIWREFADRLVRSDCTSVDAFLEKKENQAFLDLGKEAIAAALLPREHESRLLGNKKPSHSWYQQLFWLLSESVGFEEFGKNQVSVITFNYDRSFEYYLIVALQNHFYGKSTAQCYEKLKALPIVHVHGKLGRLPWEEPDNKLEPACIREPVPYGITGTVQDQDELRRFLQVAAGNIKIIHEDIGSTPDFLQAFELLRAAEKIFFLGFGFHPVNTARLRLERLDHPFVQCTTYGLAADRRKFLESFRTRKGNALFCSMMGTGYEVRHNKTIHQFIQDVGLY